MKNKCLFLFALVLFSSFLKSQTLYNSEYNYIQEKGMDPSQYLVSKFQRYDLVLLGEDHAIKDHLDFVKDLIPGLYENGVTNLCMEFGAFEMQNKLDSLMNAEEYNEQLARDMMFYYNVGIYIERFGSLIRHYLPTRRSSESLISVISMIGLNIVFPELLKI